jgi:hypothetical protein
MVTKAIADRSGYVGTHGSTVDHLDGDLASLETASVVDLLGREGGHRLARRRKDSSRPLQWDDQPYSELNIAILQSQITVDPVYDAIDYFLPKIIHFE